MDLTYATIPIFGGEHKNYIEKFELAYIVSDHDNPGNHPIYAVDDKLVLLYYTSVMMFQNQQIMTKDSLVSRKRYGKCSVDFFFDGSCSREGSGVGIVIISPSKDVIPLSYKIEFETTDNIAEYEAMILGLRAAKDNWFMEQGIKLWNYVVFPIQLGLPVMKFLQDEVEETNDVQRRIFQLIEVHQNREKLNEKYRTMGTR
jgi:hypothetical protein